MAWFEQKQVADTASAIDRYLSSKPNAMETVEGVTKWWLVRQRYEDSRELVLEALELLVAEGALEKVQVAGGKVLYRRSMTM